MRLLPFALAVLLAARTVAQPVFTTSKSLVAAEPIAITATVPAAAKSASAPDTAAAIRELFAHKRRQSASLLGLSVVGSAAGVAAASQLIWSKSPTVSGIGIASFALAVYVALPAAVVELVQLIRFNRRHEQQALDAFAAHRLPSSLKKKLKPRYFRPAS